MKNSIDAEITSGSENTLWIDQNTIPDYPKLLENIQVDIAIVGAGIAGISCAYLLSKQGYKVAVLDDGKVASGETGRTTAHLCSALDDRYYELANIFDEETIMLAAASHSAAIDFIEQCVKEENINCNFKRLPGYLFLHPSDKPENLEKELKASHKAGLFTSLCQLVPGTNLAGPALMFPDQAQFNPAKYIAALCKAITKDGGKIYNNSHVSTFDDDSISTDEAYKVEAKHIIVATNTPVNNKFVIHLKQHAYRSYVLAFKIPKNTFPEALWWDTGDQSQSHKPYHYVRTEKLNEQFDVLICGGEDHKTGIAEGEINEIEQRYQRLEQWARLHFNHLGEVLYRWSGQIMEPVDGLAYIGRNPLDSKNIYIATGDSGNGMTHGTIAALLISDLINNKQNPWQHIYDPARINFSTAKELISENVESFSHYGELLGGGDEKTADSLKAEEGAVISEGLHKIAIYKDAEQKLYKFSAICPHLGGLLHWNAAEKSFDCPVHGSRFSCTGHVQNGPSNCSLKPAE